VRGVAEGGTGALQVHQQGFLAARDAMPLSPGIVDHDAVVARLTAVSGVRAVARRIPFAGLVADASGERTGLAIMVATELDREADVSAARVDLVATGRWPRARDEAAIGAELAKALGITVGQQVSLLTNDVDGVLNGVNVTITGTLLAPTLAEKKLVVLSLGLGQELLRLSHVTELGVAIDQHIDVEDVAPAVRAAAGTAFTVGGGGRRRARATNGRALTLRAA